MDYDKVDFRLIQTTFWAPSPQKALLTMDQM